MKLKNGKFGSGVPYANWGLNEGIGDRVFTQHIDFGEDLLEVPAVEAKNINLRGFDAEIRTWSNTHVLSCGGFWLASTS